MLLLSCWTHAYPSKTQCLVTMSLQARTVCSSLNPLFHLVALYSVFIPHSNHVLVLCRESVFTAAFAPLLRGGDPAPQVCHLLHFMAQALHSGWTVCRTRHTMLLLFSPRPPAAFKWPLAEEARLIYRLEGRKQVGLGLDLFQGYDHNGNLEEGRGLIGIMSFQASVHQMDMWASSLGVEKHKADLCCVPLCQRIPLNDALA